MLGVMLSNTMISISDAMEGGINNLKMAPKSYWKQLKMNLKITKAALSEMLGVSPSTLKRWLRANDIVWVGYSKNGHWEIHKIH